MKTIRQTFSKIRTYVRRRKRRYEVDARDQGVGRRFYFTDRNSAFDKAREVATVCSRRSAQELPVELQRPDLLRRLLALLEREQKTITTDRRLPELLKEWVAARQADKLKPLRPRSFKTILFVSRRFEAIFGNAPLDDLTREKIESVFTKQSWSPQSLKNYRSYLSQFFNWSIRRGYATSNPVQHLQFATVHSTVEIYSLEQVKTIFAKLQEPEFVGLIPYFCLGLFAGVRPLEARRMTWEDNIHLATGEVEIQGEISKTRRPRRFRMEPLLLSWLTWYRRSHPDTPLLCPSFRRLYRSLQAGLGFEWISDGLRHTFGTFHYNRDKSLGPLTFMMGNSESVARKHYLTILPQNDVEGYWRIEPPRRAPKVTVTREGDSLCQKGCYPMAVLFWVSVSGALVSLRGCESACGALIAGCATGADSRASAASREQTRLTTPEVMAIIDKAAERNGLHLADYEGQSPRYNAATRQWTVLFCANGARTRQPQGHALAPGAIKRPPP